MMRIKGKILLTFSLLMIFATACAGLRTSTIRIQGLKEIYTVDEIISFKLTNNSSETLLYSIGTQKNINGKWREDVPDIKEAEYSRKIRLEELKNAQKLKLSWNPKNTFSVYSGSPGKYRLFVGYTKKKDKKFFQKYYSEEFEIK